MAARVAADLVRRVGPAGQVLVIGGGEIGSGAAALYTGCQVLGTDIYASPHTQVLADAHDLPFLDATFDAVWIQAVLEHVLDPPRVVSEIHRVLKPEGLVFADTPFLQHVHEGAYDFTRYTLSGHRWLFRHFVCLDAGATSGAGAALLWALRGFAAAHIGSRNVARALTLPFIWLPWLDGRSQRHEDVAAGVFFYGRRSDVAVEPRDMVGFYQNRSRSPKG
ncbi:class I SAM-dependent methyltransferase [Phenylobacterium sp. J426]|uniref:class I SAM-dependent methyltransferase n=1 Tax=Phenylobacterium sp. J426 TaxID=2898439 RepID=UPI002151CEF7|nr:class I SAM-dependent methyltransferase [Phenylobacterium sp. J426]MCR5876539.1 class I SAM-dependent methyltransferase [Phenylobacterium sp. J426]